MSVKTVLVSDDAGNVLIAGKAGAALTEGMPVYLDSSGVWQKAQAVGLGVAARKDAIGFAPMACQANEVIAPVKCMRMRDTTATLTIGAKVYLSATAGALTATAPTDCIQQVLGFNAKANEYFLTAEVVSDLAGAAVNQSPNIIWVAEGGDDTLNDGTFNAPYATIGKAVSSLTTAKDVIHILSGDYTLAAATDIALKNARIVGIGDVNITAAAGADYAFKLVLGALTATASLTIENVAIDHGDDASQVGLQINNTSATKKINVYLNDVEFETGGGNSVDIDHADTSNAIRMYCNRCTFEGAVNMVTADAGDRMRFDVCTLRGGVVTDAGNFDLEMLFKDCIILYHGISGGHSNQRCIYVNCVSETDADPNVYALVDGDTNQGSATDQIIGS